MTNPLMTGISNITGKTVYIRHATEADVVTVREYLNHRQKEELDFTQAEVVVAAEEDRIIGFGILEKAGDDAGCIRIAEDGRRRGIGATIAEHLMEYAPMKTIYVVEGEPSYFTKLGFTKSTNTPRTRAVAAKSVCRRDGSRPSPTTLEKHHA